MQIVAYNRYQTAGEQKVTVQHVWVADGAQAIVGHVTQSPAGTRPTKPVDKPRALGQPRESDDKYRQAAGAKGAGGPTPAKNED